MLQFVHKFFCENNPKKARILARAHRGVPVFKCMNELKNGEAWSWDGEDEKLQNVSKASDEQ